MENKVIKNILSEEQIKTVYKIIDSTPEEQTLVVTRLGHKAYMVGLGDEIKNKLQSIVQEHYGKDWVLNDYQFARYSKKYGYAPKLYPHFDQAFKTHRLTLDVQLHSTVSWPIVVEGQEFLLNDNEGIVFSGTDQIHWRSDIELSNDDVVDMIFCHCENINDPRNPITEEHIDKMLQLEKIWSDKINITREEVLVDGENNGE
jgi:hypothetical protein